MGKVKFTCFLKRYRIHLNTFLLLLLWSFIHYPAADCTGSLLGNLMQETPGRGLGHPGRTQQAPKRQEGTPPRTQVVSIALGAVVRVERTLGVHTTLLSSLASPGWSWDVLRALLTFAVPIIINLDFGSSEAGISMQLTVVEVGLAIAATHRPLVRFALLKQTHRGCLCSQMCTRTLTHLVRGLPPVEMASIQSGYREPQLCHQ